MKILEFNRLVTKMEGKKVSLTIAQINEVNKINNRLLKGEFYQAINNRYVDHKGRVVKKSPRRIGLFDKIFRKIRSIIWAR